MSQTDPHLFPSNDDFDDDFDDDDFDDDDDDDICPFCDYHIDDCMCSPESDEEL
jgi:hypothetical protein